MSIKRSLKYMLPILFILLVGKLTEKNILFTRFNEHYANHFQKVYLNKEVILQNVVDKLSQVENVISDDSLKQSVFLKETGHLYKDGMAAFLYQHDTLICWSDNETVISPFLSQAGIDSNFVYLKNAWYVPCLKKTKNFTIVGLIRIKQVYPYENKFLENHFQREFDCPVSVKISHHKIPGSYPILNTKNRIVFYLIYDSSAYHIFYQSYIPSGCYFLSFLLLLLFIFQLINHIPTLQTKSWCFLLLLVTSIPLKLYLQYHHMPEVIYRLDLFKPVYFAASDLLPSMGDLLLWAMLSFMLIFIYYRSFRISSLIRYRPKNKWMISAFLSGHLFLSLFAFAGIFFLIKSIILNSTISFEVNKLLLFDIYSLIGYLIIIMFFAAYGFYFDKLLMLHLHKVSLKRFVIILVCTYVAGTMLLWMLGLFFHMESLVFTTLFGITLAIVRYRDQSTYQYSFLVFLIALLAIYTVYIVTEFSTQKNDEQKNVLITNLASEHDPIAEYILQDINTKLINDSSLGYLVKNENINISKVYDYLKNNYFNTYFNKYILQNVTICNKSDSLDLISESLEHVQSHCYTFFNDLIQKNGTQIAGSRFYNIDHNNGRINYLGYVEYNPPTVKLQTRLYIELQSKMISEELGYPELLLDNRFNLRGKLREYSYARYLNHQLIAQYGSYAYNLSSSVFEGSNNTYGVKYIDNQDHLLFRPSPNTLIVLSSPSVTVLDLLISFSYNFLVYFLILTIIMALVNLPMVKLNFRPNFKNNIQFAMMSVLLLSLIFIGGGTLYFNIKQYYAKHQEIISEKLQSIYLELSDKIGQEKTLNADWKSEQSGSLSDDLIKLSNIFYADINLYDTKGNLIATSRPEIFEKGLVSTKINPIAYRSLTAEMHPEFIHNEKIGNLRYLSAYTPFKNNENKLIAILNLPYFTHQEELTREISTMVVAAVNFYVLLLLLTFLVTVILANRITQPLRVIQSKFSKIKLGQRYERIDYTSDDEIGRLVKEYNRMVSELERSVEMLARSERESAWREMAKQIAHEINNPLTPMKLSVQHLHRAWTDKSEHFEDYFNRISKTLIDEIDNLSAIATEFSNFAKMPTAINQHIDLIDRIEKAVDLFTNDDVNFQIDRNGLENVPIYADKEQISRVFINLIKNAIQSVKKDLRPDIHLQINTDKHYATVHLSDNGKGIPVEMQEKLFRPNFTTKTSGMGLGLAIVKNILESIGGSISYETEADKGTTFILKFPLYLKAMID